MASKAAKFIASNVHVTCMAQYCTDCCTSIKDCILMYIVQFYGQTGTFKADMNKNI